MLGKGSVFLKPIIPPPLFICQKLLLDILLDQCSFVHCLQLLGMCITLGLNLEKILKPPLGLLKKCER